MLMDLIKNIQKGLISYMKGQEGATLRDQYGQGILGMVIQCKSVTDERKRDIQALFSICQTASEQLDTDPINFIKRIVDYLNTMTTGFIFFRGQSKLKRSVLEAINIYDPRYILDINAHPIQLDPNPMTRSLDPSLAPSRISPHHQAEISLEIKQQFEQLQSELDVQKLSVQGLKDALRTMGDTVTQRDQSILDLERELLQLRSELPPAQGNSQPRNPDFLRFAGTTNASLSSQGEAAHQSSAEFHL